jgi:hypothetical protein
VCVWRAREREREISLVYVGICTRSTTEWQLFTLQFQDSFIPFIYIYIHIFTIFINTNTSQSCWTPSQFTNVSYVALQYQVRFFSIGCFFHHTIIFFFSIVVDINFIIELHLPSTCVMLRTVHQCVMSDITNRNTSSKIARF